MNIGLGIGIPFTRSSLWSNIFTPTALFMDGSTEGVWYDPSDIKLNWRRNLLTETEFRNGLIDAPTRDGLISATTLNGYQGAIVFGHDGVTSSFAYKSISVTALTTYNISVVVEMSDGLAPTFGSSFGSDSANDFVFVVAAAAVSPITYSVKNFGGTLYRVSATYTAPGAVNGITVGIVKYATNSSRTFKVSAYQLELGSTSTEYQRITDGIQDYLTYQPLPVLYQDAAGTTPVTAVEQPVGLMLDKSKGLVLGPELVSNGGFSNGTTGWSAYSAIAGGVISNSSGSLLVSNNGGTYARGATALTGLVVGKWYKVTGTCLTSSNGAVVRVTTASDAASGYVYNNTVVAVGAINFQFAATATTLYLAVGIESAVATAVASFDNISVRELPGNHTYQTVSTKRGTLSARRNRLVGTETLATQTATTRATPYILSFYGTGTVTLSGTSTAGPLVGTGANNRVYLEFTPTAGTLTLTVSGTVLKAQLEVSNEGL